MSAPAGDKPTSSATATKQSATDLHKVEGEEDKSGSGETKKKKRVAIDKQ